MFDISLKYYHVFNDVQTTLLLMLIEKYINGTEIQVNRITRTRKVMSKSMFSHEKADRIRYQKQFLKLQMDIHFYFICIGQVSKCFDRLCNKLKDKELEVVKTKFQKQFNQEIRNDLEHIDARAVGLKKKGRKEISIGHIQDFGNYENDKISFNGKKYPVNKEMLKKLKEIFKEIISVINNNYALKDESFVYWLQREKQTKKIMRSIKKYSP